MKDEVLASGNSTLVTRVGQTVRRTAGAWTPAVHAFLDALRAAGVTEVPESLGLDEHGREVLTFIPGDAAHYPLPQWVWSPSILHDAGTLLRRLHDASVGLAGADLRQLPTHYPARAIVTRLLRYTSSTIPACPPARTWTGARDPCA